mgnify:FL=1
MSLPESIRNAVEAALDPTGVSALADATPQGGGCINDTLRVRTSAGREAFLKWNPSAPPDFFHAEKRGLTALRSTIDGSGIKGMRIPEVLALGETEAGSWLLLEWVDSGSGAPGFWKSLGSGLARLHRAPVPEGLREPNYIGPLPQDNAPAEGWPEFWVERRLIPQYVIARDAGHFQGRTGREMEGAMERTSEALPDLSTSDLGLLHGDLWSGNTFPDPLGRAVLVDPAVYPGDPRVDLAMTELFGGFAPAFRQAYDSVLDPGPEYDEVLRDAYQLYPLLVHVNLFGGSYVQGALDRARRILRL